MDTSVAGKVFTGVAVGALALTAWMGSGPHPEPRDTDRQQEELRVCADPNNLPFSNREEEGFHNELAELFASELGLSGVGYTWWPQRRGFVRNTLKKNKCDVIFGVPEGYDILQSSEPFYRSPYVFLYRSDADFEVTSLDDPVLRELDIGVNLIGDDYMNPPPAHALGARGIVGNVKGFTVYGDYDEESPPRRIVEAVAKGDVELAIVWGPVAGYWGHRQDVALTMNALPAVDDSTGFPLAYRMSLGVRRGEDEWQARLEKVIAENHDTIYSILEKYHVPLLPLGEEGEGEEAAEDETASTAAETGAPAPVAGLASGEPGVEGPAGGSSRRVPAAHEAARRPLAEILRTSAGGAARDTPVSETVYNGWKWFMVYCTRCHGETGTGSTFAPSLLAAVNREGFVRDSFVTTVMEGRPDKGMPAWNELLTEKKAGALYEYIVARTEGLSAGRPEGPPADTSKAEAGEGADDTSTSDGGAGGGR